MFNAIELPAEYEMKTVEVAAEVWEMKVTKRWKMEIIIS